MKLSIKHRVPTMQAVPLKYLGRTSTILINVWRIKLEVSYRRQA